MEKQSHTLPDFFICGAARSGTTSLWRYLNQHPSIFMPSTMEGKEPGYFSELRPMNDPDEYARLFENANPDQMVGEASGAYLTSPDSARRIAETLPEAKIIIMLRNPADRAFALYKWMVQQGYEVAGSFERALVLEKTKRYNNEAFKRYNPEYYYNYLYFHSGLYSRQVERYLDRIPRNQLHFIIFEEFVDQPIPHVQQIYDFLGVDNSFTPRVNVHNRSRETHFPKLQYALRQLAGSFGNLDRSFPVRLLMKLNTSPKKEKLDPKLRQELLEAYSDDIHRTETLINRNLTEHWF